MAYKYKLFLIVFSINIFGYSQIPQPVKSKIKKYKSQILEAPHDTIKLRLYREISNLYVQEGQFEEGLFIQDSAYTIAKRNENEKYIAIALYNKMLFNYNLGNYKKSLFHGKKLIPLAKKINYSKLPYTYVIFAKAYRFQGEYDSMFVYSKKLLDISDDKNDLYEIHTNLGIGYLTQQLFKEGMEQFMIARETAQELEPYYHCEAIVNIGVSLTEMEHFDEALLYFNEAIQIANENNYKNVIAYCENSKGNIFQQKKEYNKALKSLSIAHKIASEINDNINLMFIIYTQGDVYRLKKEYNIAISKYKEALEVEKKYNTNIKQSFLYTELGKVYFELKNEDMALTYLDSALIAKTPSYIKMDYNELLSKIYENKEDHVKAYFYYKNFIRSRDSIDSIARKTEAYALEADYQFKQKEDEIEILNTKNKLRESQLYMLIGFVGLTLLLLFFIYSRFKTKARINKQLKELDKTKTRFFTNISHEFRTPLSLMLGPIQTVLKDTKEPNSIANLNLAYKNGTRLHNMVNQLLDLSKIESNSIPLEVEEVMISDFLKVIFSYFSSMADEKRIDYKIEIDDSLDMGFLDKDKVEKILINLLSNAFKFTPNDGSIKLSAYKNEEQLIIKISDSGVGIPKDKIDKIFNRFYQVDDSQTRTAEGSGIGLALSKELADTHKGSLKATSKEEQGSTFTLKIPIKKGAYNKDEIRVGLSLSAIKDISDIELIENKLTPNITGYKKEQPLLLIVEDNVDMQNFIASILNEEYNILIASNGKEAYSIALEEVPDIIISDYMMPVMDGMNFSKMIRNQEATSHIPIVMLTAKNEQSTKLESLETGVNSFLTKPFNTDELQLVVNNIMEQQNKLKKLYAESSTLPVKDISLPSSEKSFIERMMTIFEEKYGLTYFGVEQLSDELCLSRVQIYRKVKALTGESPGDLLRVFRLEKAKILLEKSSSNVGEVSEKVGFGNQSNFANKFKKHTGMSPSDYINKQSSS